MTGTVVGQAGKPIENATVEIKSEATGSSTTATTNSDGRFSATALAPGGYTITVSAQGFALTARPGAQVTTGRNPGRLDSSVRSDS